MIRRYLIGIGLGVLVVPLTLLSGAHARPTAGVAREPAVGMWLLDHGNHPYVLSRISVSGPEIVATAYDGFRGTASTPLLNVYDSDRDNVCVVASGTVIARFSYQGLNTEGRRMYQGSLLGAKLSSDGRSCTLIPPGQNGSAAVHALLEPYGDSYQKPPLPFGPVNQLKIFKQDHWNNGRPGWAATTVFSRKSGTAPMPTKGSVEVGLWQNARNDPFISFDVASNSRGDPDWGPRNIRNLQLHHVTALCSTWSPTTQSWSNAQRKGLMSAAVIWDNRGQQIKDDGTVSDSLFNLREYHFGRLQAKFNGWSSVTGKVRYAEFTSASPGKTIEEETHSRGFNPDKPGPYNVNRCEVTTDFTASYGY